jgi:hypothetical protein
MAAAGSVRLRALLAQRGRGGGGARPGLPELGGAGHLVVTLGNETDFNHIESDILDLCRRFRVVTLGCDPWQATQMAQRLRAEGVAAFEFRATTQNFSPAVLELDAALRSSRLRHDGAPVLGRCIGDVVGRPDRRGNLYPAKQRPEQKIDAAVALMMAIGRAMAASPTSVTSCARPYSPGWPTARRGGLRGRGRAALGPVPPRGKSCWLESDRDFRRAAPAST